MMLMNRTRTSIVGLIVSTQDFQELQKYITQLINMGHAIVVIFSWVFFISISALLVVILGTYLADTFKDSRFDKWWRRHIIDDIPEELED
jgi:hypothetical protein